MLAGQLGGSGNTNGTGTKALLSYSGGVVSDHAGHLFVADTGNSSIREVAIATGQVTTLAGSLAGAGSADGTGTAASFSGLNGLAYDGAGNLYVADTINDTIRKVVVTTGAVTTIAGLSGTQGSADGTGTNARFYYPWGLVYDGQGDLFVVDNGNSTIRKLVLTTGAVTTVAGTPGMQGTTDGTGANARFADPIGLALDGAGNLFVADTWNGTIRQIVVATAAVTTLAGSKGIIGNADGVGTAATFNTPYGLTADGAGNLFVADTANDSIRQVVIATGVVTTLTLATPARSGAVGFEPPPRFWRPQAVASDGAGELFVADSNDCTIRQVAVATGVITTVAGVQNGAGSTNGNGTSATFYSPAALAADNSGNVFVADAHNSTIRQLVIETGAVTTVAGTAGTLGNSDGTGQGASFNGPFGLADDGAGDLFVSDTYNDTIREVVVATGVVTTVAGSPGASGNTDGLGSAARFYYPYGLTYDGAGNLFIADWGNETIRQLVLSTGAVTTVAGSAGVQGSTDGVGPAASFYHPEGTHDRRGG